MTTMTIIVLAIKITESKSIYLNKDYAERKAKALISKYDSSINPDGQLSIEELTDFLINEDSCLNRVAILSRVNQEKKKPKYIVFS